MTIEVYAGKDHLFYWRAVHRNGNIVADSGEGYSSRSNARRAVKRFADVVQSGRFTTVQL